MKMFQFSSTSRSGSKRLFTLFLLLISVFRVIESNAQCPNPAFSIPTTCSGSPLVISNTSTNANSYRWDFTPGFFRSTGTVVSDLSLGASAMDVTVMNQNDTTVAFYFKSGTGSIFRSVYANGPGQPVTNTDDLGNLGVLAQPSDIDFYQENSNWYGLIVDYNSCTLTRLKFGSSLLNTPDSVEVLFTVANSNLLNPWSIKIGKEDSGNIFAISSNFSTGTITYFQFGNSILNMPTASAPIPVPGLGNVFDAVIAKECGNIYAFLAGYSSTKIIKASFGTSINATPTFTEVISDGLPSDFAIINDSLTWKLLSTNLTTNDIRKYDLGPTLSTNNTATIIGIESFGGGNPKGIEMIRQNNSQYLFIQNYNTSNLQVVKYTNNVNVSSAESFDAIPSGISFNGMGTYPVQLTAIDANGNESSTINLVQILNSPISNFSSSGFCFGDSTFFVDSSYISSGVINSWSWDFGDGDTSSLQNPVHLFQTTGQFTVLLETEGAGCTNQLSQTITVSPKPVAYFATSEICSNTPYTFLDSSTVNSGTITQWDWDFGNSDSSILQNPIEIYATGGNYNVTLTVTTDQNCSGVYTDTMLVNSGPIAGFQVLNTCLGLQTAFINQTDVNGSGISGYIWDFGDGNNDTTSNPNYSYAATIADYTVELIATSTNGCNDTASSQIHISNIPTASFLSPVTICMNNPVTFTDLSSVMADTISGWLWDFGDGTTDSVKNPVHSFTTAGVYNVTLVSYSPSSCPSASTQQTITVLESPVAYFNYSSTCFGTTTSFTDLSTPASGSSIASYNWQFGTGDSSVFANTFYTFNSASTFPVTLTITSVEGCLSDTTISITIHNQPIANFSTSNTCSDQSTLFTNMSSADSLSSVATSTWNFGDFSSTSNTSTLTSPTHVYDTTGNFSVSLITTTNFGCSDTVIKTVSIYQTAPVNFTYSPTCKGDLMEFFNPGSSLDSLYSWNFGDGQFNQLKEPAHYYAVANNYTVTLTVTTTRGCRSTATRIVTVSPIPLANFDLPGGCLGSVYQFTNNSTISTGSIVSYDWNITEENLSLTGPTPSYFFGDTGSYHVQLTVVSDIGCQNSLTKVLKINELPVANFSFDPQYGNPPLDVHFTDQSIGANSYFWTFGADTTTATSFDPSFLYQDTGQFTITHIVTSIFGCKDTISKNIYVIKPYLDIAITGDSSYIDGDNFNIIARIANKGTLEINQVEMKARLGDGNEINEVVYRSIPNGPAGIQTYYFSAKFQLSSGINTDYYCIKATNPNGDVDDVPGNNEMCFNLDREVSIQNPFPNPADGNFTIRVLIPSKRKAEVNLYDQLGRKMISSTINQSTEGFFDQVFDTSQLLEGIYNVEILYQDNVYYKQVVVSHPNR